METTKGNKLILDLMEKEYNEEFLLQYHLSWDWLMPVVEKIENLGYFCMINKRTSIYTGTKDQKISITTIEGNTKILNTWKAIIAFIEWYNKNK